MIAFHPKGSIHQPLQLEFYKWEPFLQELAGCSNHNEQEVLTKINNLLTTGNLETSDSIENVFLDLGYRIVTENGIPLLLKKEVDEQNTPEVNLSAQHPQNPFLPFDLYSSQLEIKTNEAFQRAKDDNKKDPVFDSISDKIGLGLFPEAKKELGELLESIEDKDIEKSIAGFQLMSEIHLKEGKYPEAAGILWYAKKLDEEGISHKKIDAQLDFIERSLLRKATHANGPIRGITQSEFDQKKLKKLREKIKEEYDFIKLIEDNFERVQALRRLYREVITKGLKTFIHELAQDVINQMAAWGQKAPCEYALIGLGSLAREEMTPYSDFEFAILIDSENEKDKEFFRLFTNLLHLRFINLGETILPSLDIQCLDWVFDTITPRGLSFDGSMPTACKTPLGKKRNQGGDYELIHSPEKMSQLQFINVKEPEQDRLWILKRYHLPSILSTCTYVTGSNQGIDLVSEYQKKVQTILEEGEGKQRAFDLIKDDFDHFKPRLVEGSGKHYNVKKDLYRLPNTMFDGLANYFCLKATSTWERIEELEKEILTPSAAQDLKELMMLSQELRLSTYLSYNCQREHLDIDKQKIKLQELYYRVFPFLVAMERFCSEIENGCPEACLKNERFYENSSFHQGCIAFRHMNYLEAHHYLSLEAFDTLDYYELLGSVKYTLAKYEEAEKAYLKAIEKKPSCELYMKLGSVRQSLAHYKKDKYGDESVEEALFKAKELAEELDDELLKERVHRALTSLYKECGDYISARNHLSMCKEISEKRTSNKARDPEYGVIIDLDLAKTKELEAEILNDLDNEFNRSIQLLQNAKTIFKGYYRRKDHPAVLRYKKPVRNLNEWKTRLEDREKTLNMQIAIFGEKHPDVADSYINLAYILGNLGRQKKAFEYEQKVLNIFMAIFGENHPQVALPYNLLGNRLAELGMDEKGLECHEKALKIMSTVFRKNHPYIAGSYNNIGVILGKLGKYQEALKCEQKALDIVVTVFGENHSNVANAYNNLGSTLEEFGKYEEGLEYQQKALDIRLAIFGEMHSDVATSYANVGNGYRMIGKYEEALRCQQKALEIIFAIFGEKHFLLANLYNIMGGTLEDLNRFEEALSYQQKALKIRLLLFGEEHPDVATLYNNMGGALINLGEYKEALKYQQKALGILLAVFGENHPHTATSYNNLGVTLGGFHQYKEALKYKQKALKIRLAVFGKKHPFVVGLYASLGDLYFTLKDYVSAVLYLKRVLESYQSNPNYQLHLEIVDIHAKLADSYLLQNNKEKYREHFNESQKISREIDNQKAFQKHEGLLKDLLLNKKYREAYGLLAKLPKYLKNAIDFLCLYMQTALLCPGLNKKILEKHLHDAETALNNGEGSIPTRLKLCINLAAYWLKSNKWEKVNACIVHLQKLLDKAPTFCFQYTLLDLLPFEDNQLIEDECIPVEILRNFIALKMYHGKKNHQIFSVVAKQLIQKVDALEASGYKTEEIKNFCLECLQEQEK